MAKIGLFGGSFNPIHNGHINLAVSVKNELKLDKVIFIPSGTAPHKSSNEYASAEDRLKMCRLALEDYDDFEISDYELCRQGKSYTVYTVRHFKQLYPYDELVLMVGSDMLLTFDQWYEYREILGKVTLAAISRCGTDLNQLYKMSEKLSLFGKTIVVNASAVTISSTKIRKMIKNNEDISCYLNGKVVKYIMLKNLYS
ncbi:nicotinate (nicotinamide) nucleotide adenylyltransferase [Porcipelethomonas sp.]|uniref:nicotinate (nicotinamide) nucleotide adenylyltransferase n=1 Tax=Porcipelethomonas sp. TaxID=2981675 RepID=UPI0030768ABF